VRFARVQGRLSVITAEGAVDVGLSSGGRFDSDPDNAMPQFDALLEWASASADGADARPYSPSDLGAPILRPAQVFGVGLNYRAHAAESGVAAPTYPPIFTKFPTCLAGPHATVELPSGQVDWEVELVVAIGRRAVHVSEEKALSYVAGYMTGQDLSERAVQLAGPVPQFSLGKSFPGFGPTGPALVTLDEIPDPNDLPLRCSVDGEILQDGRTRDMIMSVPELIARLSAICPLLPGDLIFTGTPPGVGMARDPKRYLQPGTTLVSAVDHIGELSNPLVAGLGYTPGA
jgi:2-keto-4-pentenoate hydratase/2-oxohepta-3-ene-1,7-dioic acid hydratase in catechol pathway